MRTWVTDAVRESVLKIDSRRKIPGVEPGLAFQSDALPAELSSLLSILPVTHGIMPYVVHVSVAPSPAFVWGAICLVVGGRYVCEDNGSAWR